MRSSLVAAVLLAVAAPVHADRVHLQGGNVIEGKATQHGDTVTVEIDAGAITLPRDSVVKIERAESPVQRFEARYAALAPGDVQGLLELADYCRDHGMPARERELLQKVVEHAPDHAQARARLGYVRSGTAWVTREEHMRAQGMVQHQGQWVTREQALELERLKAETDKASRERDKAQLELKRQELAVEQARAEAEAEASKARAAQAALEQERVKEQTAVPPGQPYVVWGSPVHEHDCPRGYVWSGHREGCKRIPERPRRPSPFIVGAKDPFDFVEGR